MAPVLIAMTTWSCLGVPSAPSNQIIVGLSLFLTFFIMGPVFNRVNDDALRPYLKHRVEMTAALHRHPGIAGAMEAAEQLLRAVPGVTVVQLDVPAVGLQSVNLAALPNFKKELQLKELEAARAAGVNRATVYAWKADDADFADRLAWARIRVLDALQDALVDRAVGSGTRPIPRTGPSPRTSAPSRSIVRETSGCKNGR